MLISTVAIPYANALLKEAQKKDEIERLYKNVLLILKALKDTPELGIILKSPVLPVQRKAAILHQLCSDKTSKLLVSFFDLMLKKRRGPYIHASLEAFIYLYYRIKHIIKAQVVSPIPLDNDYRKIIEEAIQTTYQGTVDLETTINTDLIGGFILTVNNKRLDASISGKLRHIRKTLLN